SHLATTYAVVLALTVAGGEEAYEVIDRRAMWKWLCSLKQPEGGFQMALGGEVDVRYVLGRSIPLPFSSTCRLLLAFLLVELEAWRFPSHKRWRRPGRH